jgi:crotonobetainyl-CoA:carnitine CoA-transferase CaiB-like acyl-CoA transferase
MPPSDPLPRVDALAGLRVLDFSIMMAGPYCARLFADMGADVLVENFRPGAIDSSSAVCRSALPTTSIRPMLSGPRVLL